MSHWDSVIYSIVADTVTASDTLVIVYYLVAVDDCAVGAGDYNFNIRDGAN